MWRCQLIFPWRNPLILYHIVGVCVSCRIHLGMSHTPRGRSRLPGGLFVSVPPSISKLCPHSSKIGRHLTALLFFVRRQPGRTFLTNFISDGPAPQMKSWHFTNHFNYSQNRTDSVLYTVSSLCNAYMLWLLTKTPKQANKQKKTPIMINKVAQHHILTEL